MWDMETALNRHVISERVVVFADACHSAGVGFQAGLRGVSGNNLINSYIANLYKSRPGRVVITASESDYQVAQFQEIHDQQRKSKQDHLFQHFLLEGLNGKADMDGNGIVTISEVFTFVSNKVRRATHSQQHPNIQGEFDGNLPLSVLR